MAILSTLLSVTMPTGMWESILWAFDGFTKNYVWAVVLLTIIIRLIWAPLDTINRRITTKNAAMQAKLQPELQKIQEKYGRDKQLVNQKTNELYRKNNHSVMGSCGFMLIFMALNLVIFFTLFSGLNNVASYKIYKNYENLKENYSNCLILVDENLEQYKSWQSDKQLEFKIWTEETTKMIGLFEKDTEDPLVKSNYLTLDQIKEKDTLDGEIEDDVLQANDYILVVVDRLEKEVLTADEEETEDVDETFTVADSVREVALPLIQQEYLSTKDGFLWIQNIWIADSPFKSSVFDYTSFAGMVRAGLEKNEDKVYNQFMPALSISISTVNGYLILPLLVVAVSLLSMWLSQVLSGQTKKKGGKTQGIVMQIIMPIIMGVFAVLYNAVFSIYMLTGQIISTLLLPLQQLIVKKWDNMAEKKKLQQNSGEIDYRRKS